MSIRSQPAVRPIARVDAAKLATGRAVFAGDALPAGALHGAVLRSPHAHARVRRVDATRARALAGVACVLSHEDGAPLSAELFFRGDRVALVAASDPELARHAAEAVEVDYELLPAGDAALELPALLVVERGDLQAGFAAAERRFEGRYSVPALADATLEPRVSAAWLDEDGRLVVRTSSERPFAVRRALAAALGLASGGIRVVAPRVGGGFLRRAELLTEDVCAALALRTGRPVRYELPAAEAGRLALTLPGLTADIRSGVREGRLVALEACLVEEVGAVAPGGEAPVTAGFGAFAAYDLANLRCEVRRRRGHAPPAPALDAHASPDVSFALESHLDEIALGLGEDPLDFRSRNLGPAAAESGLELAIAAGSARVGWAARREQLGPERPAPRPGPPRLADSLPRLRRGLGMALATAVPGLAVTGSAGAALRLVEDGALQLVVGVPDGAAGAHTRFASIVASELGIGAEHVSVQLADTDAAPAGSEYGDPATHDAAALAVLEAAQGLKRQLLERAGALLALPPRRLRLREGLVSASDGRTLTLERIAHARGEGTRAAPLAAVAARTSSEAPAAGAAVFVEVELDLETGATRAISLLAAVDVGRALNPRLVEGRVEGALCRGAARALGACCGVLSTLEAPQVSVVLVPTQAPAAPRGEKALGSIVEAGAAAALANAVAHASGARVRELPLSPDRILASIREARQ
ncbi:MAG: xanthine dehydrogenase family protein molybdopterin-binding subunit [Vicinamibacteria bacterium]